MANLSGFDANNIDPAQDFTPLPTGEYRAQIVDSEMRPTKKGDGNYLALEYDVLDGQYKGRKVWSRHNLDNPNPKASEIAQRELSAICHAVGVLRPNDSTELHYKPMVIRVEFVPAGGNKTKDGNDVKAWKKDEGGLGNAPTATTAGATSASTTASPSSPPWARAA